MQNRRHLIRAIELGGLPEANRDYIRKNTIVVGITIDNQTLRNRVLRRTEAMLKAGVLQEVSQAAAKYGWDSEAMTGSVYRILRQYLEGNIPLYTALEKVVQSDMQLAKRQRTWFKRNHFIVWGDNTEELKKRVTGFLGNSV